MSIPVAPTETIEPGSLLGELDRRQDDVLAQLDDLQAKIDEVLGDLGVTSLEDLDSIETE